MHLFGKAKRKRSALEEAAKKASEARKEELERIVSAKPVLSMPSKMAFSTAPVEYKSFLKEVRPLPQSAFEKIAAHTEKLRISPPKNMAKRAAENISTAYMAVTPTGVWSLAVLFFFAWTAVALVTSLFDGGTFSVICGMIALGGAWYIWSYPSYLARSVVLRMSADAVMAVLYMVIYMRSSPNMEGAIRFASENLTGPLSLDLKKLMWDIHVGVYPSADAAVAKYIEKWKGANPEFAEALNLLRGSAVDPARRAQLFTETVDLILESTAERTRRYVGGLRMPVMMIHAMGVLLPVMGLVLFPIVLIFMGDSVKPAFVFLGYDLILPAFLWLFIDYILRARPPTFSQPDVSLAKGVPPLGKFNLRGKVLPIWPLALMIIIPFVVIPLYMIGGCLMPNTEESVAACTKGETVGLMVNLSLLPILGLGVGIAFAMLLDSQQKMKVRQDIEKIEDEFSVALFQLGNRISGGTPIEASVEKSVANLKGMKIAELFSITASNMRRFGMTFEQALFDPQVGAVWWWPSRLVRSVMGTIMEASRKGMTAASEAMLTISNYLKGVHAVKGEVDEVLGETISSMKFLAMLLTPLVAGVTITMAVVIIQILASLGAQFQQLPSDSFTGMSPLTGMWSAGLGGKLPISPTVFQLIVGLYMIETIVLLSVFVNRIQYGDDAIGLRATLGYTMLFGIFIYVVSWFITYTMFGSSLTTLLSPVTG